ncbi:MAG: DUF1178 family protein [Pseudomonadota bacterium]
MIKFTLKCDRDHRFDSWFASADAFDKLNKSGMVTCAVCGSNHVEKALMAPNVRDSKTAHAAPAEGAQTPMAAKEGALTTPSSPNEIAIAEMRRKIEKNSEYVGMSFAQEARDIHNGDAPERAIYGEAKPQDAKALLEEGVPVAPLPFVPGRKTN